MDLNELPTYNSHKEVQAGRITSIDNIDEGVLEVQNTVTQARDVVSVETKVFSRYTPKVGDYIVLYKDGYVSVSPRDAFEDGYVLK